MVKKCPNCNHYISDTANNCPNCGINLNAESTLSTKDRETPSEILSKLNEVKRPEGIYLYALNGKISFVISDSGIQVYISSSRKEDGEELYKKTHDAYQRFKLSSYYSEFSYDEDECDEKEISLLSDGKLVKENANEYIVELLKDVFEINSLNQIQIENIKTSKGCLGFILFIISSLTVSIFI